MKRLLLLASCLAASAANAADVNLGRLPASDYADTETEQYEKPRVYSDIDGLRFGVLEADNER